MGFEKLEAGDVPGVRYVEELTMLFRPVAGQVPVGKVSGGRREISDLLLGQICYLVGVDIDRRPTRTRLVRAVSTDGALG
jgi:hypothetical protein